MIETTFRHSVVAAFLLVVLGCKSPPAAVAPGAYDARLSGGYALLYELVDKQSGVGQALILGGGMSEKTKSLIREIAQSSKVAAQTLKNFAEQDPALRLDDAQLPWVEQKSREAEESQTTSRMLLAGKKFEFRLLLSQTKSMPYGSLLARELAAIESNRDRKQWLTAFAKEFDSYRDRAEERLAVKEEP